MANECKTAVVPKLRFPEFRETVGWDVLPMGRLMSLEYGASLPEHSRRPGSIPVMGSNGVVGYHDKALVTGPAIVIGRKGSVGEVNWVDKDCCPIDTTYYVENKQPSSSSMQFLYRLLQCSKLNQRGDPGAVPGLNRNAVHSLQTAIPKALEQKKVADCLNSLDELIAAQGRKVEALKIYKRGLMQRLFPREGETLPRLRFPEFRDAPEWEEATIGSRSKSFSGGTPDTANKSYYGGEIPFIRSAEIGKRKTELSLTELGFKSSAAKLVEPGDVLVALYGANSGDVALAKIGGAINQAILCLRPEGDRAFLHHFLAAKKDWILSTFIQGGQGNLSGEIIKSISLRFPSKEEQAAVAACLSSLDARIVLENEIFEALRVSKKGLMQQLFPSLEEA